MHLARGFSRLGYNSQMGDELTGLTYLRARYYKPEIGRFTQEDVIYDDGFNLYAYCSSNPVIYCDPSGFSKKEKDFLVEIVKAKKVGQNQRKKNIQITYLTIEFLKIVKRF